MYWYRSKNGEAWGSWLWVPGQPGIQSGPCLKQNHAPPKRKRPERTAIMLGLSFNGHVIEKWTNVSKPQVLSTVVKSLTTTSPTKLSVFPIICSFSLRQGLSMKSRNSFCKLGGPGTQQSACFCLLSAGIKDVSLWPQHLIYYRYKKSTPAFPWPIKIKQFQHSPPPPNK